MRSIVLIIMSLLACACGILHGPGYSMNDQNYFMESPKLVMDDVGYNLVWRYGELGFYFSPECRVKKYELLCSLQGTSSSGSLTGKYGKINLHQPSEIEAIENNKSYWLEPDGTKIKIAVVNNA